MKRIATTARRLAPLAAVLVLGAFAPSAVGSHVAPTIRDLDMANLGSNERELNIAVDPNDPDHLAAGANERGGGNTQEWYTSTDGGRNWTSGDLPTGTLTVPGTTSTLMSDPSLAFGSSGDIYYSALMHGGTGEPCTLFVSTSTDDGTNWSDPANGVVAAGGGSVCQDKEHIMVDRANNDNVYVAWTPVGGANNWNVVFSRDLNGRSDGLAFSAPVVLSTAGGNSGCLNQGADFAQLGGTIYVIWSSFCSGFADGDPFSVWVTSSGDQGQNWTAPVQIGAGDNVDFTGLGFRSRSHPAIAAAGGRIFGIWAEYADTSNDADADVHMVSSTDGTNWTAEQRVNQDSGTTDQWMGWVDAGQGKVLVGYFSRANASTNIEFHASYGAIAATPALTEVTVSSAGVAVGNPGFLGDYNGMAIGSDDVAHPAWGDARTTVGGATDAFTARIDFSPPSAVAISPLTPTQEVGTIANFTATVTGAHGELEHFIPVQFTVTGGGTPSATFASGDTSTTGTFAFSFTNTTALVNTVTAWADLDEDGTQDAGETASTTITWQPGPPANLTLAPTPSTNTIDETHTVTATVTDQYGNLVLPVDVRFSVAGANGILGLPTSGTATTSGGLADFSYVGVLPGADTITAFADYDGDGVRDPAPSDHEPQATADKTWLLPPSTDGAKITGGGSFAVALGDANFGFTAQKRADDPDAKGNVLYDEPGRHLKGLTIDSITVSGATGRIFGTATLNGSGSYVFRIDVVDGSPDTFRLRMSDGYDTGVQSPSGSIQIH